MSFLDSLSKNATEIKGPRQKKLCIIFILAGLIFSGAGIAAYFTLEMNGFVQALLLLGAIFSGACSFYAGKFTKGVLYLITYGLAGIGAVIDLVLIFTGKYRDAEGNALVD